MKILRAFAFAGTLLFAGVSTFAAANNSTEIVTNDDAKKTEIKKEDLPAAALSHLNSTYKDVPVKVVYKVSDEQGTVTGYEVVITKDGTDTTIKYDAKGNNVK